MTDSPVLAVPSRRTVLRSAAAGLVVAGLAVAGATGAQATNRYNLQNGWAWCSLCSQAYHPNSWPHGDGVCPKQPGNGHATPGWNYSMVYNQATTNGLPGTPGYQNWWFWCQYCHSLYFSDFNPGGCCPAERGNGSHDPGASWVYAVPVGESGSSYQAGWNWCRLCSAYYHSNNGSGTDAGFCWVNSNTLGSGSNAHAHGSSWPYRLIH